MDISTGAGLDNPAFSIMVFYNGFSLLQRKISLMWAENNSYLWEY